MTHSSRGDQKSFSEVTLKLRLRSKVSMVKTAKGWRCHAARWRRVWRRERLRYR